MALALVDVKRYCFDIFVDINWGVCPLLYEPHLLSEGPALDRPEQSPR